ncbi:MAG: hypothetical protein E2O68_03430 [Deltaproteobacteria bacterium]|nr:MAG: hypothetical protein E2O68_03430 [Deltaproteobacteria bacterium]
MNSFEELLKGLELLNAKLASKDATADLTIVGSMSIYLNNLKIERFTQDIDYINYEPDDDFNLFVAEVAEELNLKDNWINSRAATLRPLPIDLKDKLKIDNRFSNIILRVINREILIQLKIYAAYMRGAKDLEDLSLLEPKVPEIAQGIEYIRYVILENHGQVQLDKEGKDISKFERFLNEQFK